MNALSKLIKALNMGNIPKKYKVFACFCIVILAIFASWLLFFNYGMYDNGYNFLYIILNIIFRVVFILSIVVGIENRLAQIGPTDDMNFLNFSFKQQVKYAQISAEKKGFSIKELNKKLMIYNKFVLIEYNPSLYYQFKCSELNSNPRVFEVNAMLSSEYLDTGFIKVIEQMFSDTNYDMAIRIFQRVFEVDDIKEYIPKEYMINSKKIDINTPPPVIEFNLIKIDINNASEQQIASLEGINIVSAKRAVRHRDLKGGFKTFSEFAKVVNLKNRFVSKVRPRIEIGDYNKTKANEQEQEGRVVDF